MTALPKLNGQFFRLYCGWFTVGVVSAVRVLGGWLKGSGAIGRRAAAFIAFVIPELHLKH